MQHCLFSYCLIHQQSRQVTIIRRRVASCDAVCAARRANRCARRERARAHRIGRRA